MHLDVGQDEDRADPFLPESGTNGVTTPYRALPVTTVWLFPESMSQNKQGAQTT